ncbi:hypothetical protein [Mesonia maritima]|uniref:Uncharacterized protein n=1 Tax=Mesonia maritima TaxID=1793873 RepID=A0ABU1K3F3_9FLAO|nr:hypothetical protein [Mesonia maritima]MDR6300140.1 hypothetical protein [Mesonia maritima]
MKPKYTPNFITLNQLFKKHLDLDEKPIVILINDEIMSEDYKEFLVDENFILKIIVNNLTTSQKNTEVNLIKIITKTSEKHTKSERNTY